MRIRIFYLIFFVSLNATACFSYIGKSVSGQHGKKDFLSLLSPQSFS